MNLSTLRGIARILGLRRAARSLRTPSPRQYAWRTAREARLAACRRMHPRALWRRIRRGTWSPTAISAARQILTERALED